MTKLIIFDLGGVVFTNGTKQFIQNLSERYSLNPEIVKDVLDGNIGTQYREGKITRDTFWEQVIKTLHLTENANMLEAEWINNYGIIQRTKDIIFALKGKYKLFYLSDNVHERVQKLNEKYNFLEWFDDGIFSHDVGVKKPDPRIYELTLQKAHVKPEEAVFIDDKQSSLDPAEKLGITSILFSSTEKLRESLEQLHIL